MTEDWKPLIYICATFQVLVCFIKFEKEIIKTLCQLTFTSPNVAVISNNNNSLSFWLTPKGQIISKLWFPPRVLKGICYRRPERIWSGLKTCCSNRATFAHSSFHINVTLCKSVSWTLLFGRYVSRSALQEASADVYGNKYCASHWCPSTVLFTDIL